MYWTVHLTGGPRRVNHAAVLNDNKIFTFGGYCSGEDYVKRRPMDVYVLNTDTLRWSPVPVARKGCPQYSQTPYQRYGHSAVVHEGKIYIWGGRNDRFVCNQLFCFNCDTRQWSCPKVCGQIPEARDGHSACVYQGNMYIFGGYIDEETQFTQDVYVLDLTTFHWSFIETWGEPPSYRDFHTANIINGRMFVWGGRGDESALYHSGSEVYCPDLVYLDLKHFKWVRPNTTGSIPVGRRSHSAFVYQDCLYIFGGYNGLVEEHYNDIYRYCTQAQEWSQVRPHGPQPTKRRRQSCIVNGDTLIMFGGSSPLSALDKESQAQMLLSRPYLSPVNNTARPNDPLFGESNLIDNDDLHILDFAPTLRTLALVAVIKYNLSTKYLPRQLLHEVRAMSTANSVRSSSKTG
uniref:Kelch domain-containing protein 3 n=1 Tax=Cacopsylla melanoneura TaxID=428564 RepID=A0A8D8S3I2_9HEMI